jgi:4-amino-4-deoxy-L-arabinose transferase-like glycosyltransferase
MLMSYLGTLKTLLYWPVLTLGGVSVWTLRLPVVGIGGITILVFYSLCQRSVGRAAALLGSFLLATDPVFLLTNTFDWGPVAFEHALLVTACWFLLKFGRCAEGRSRDLAAGFFCLGLAVWNKAIFLWALSGLAAGTLAAFWPELRRNLSLRSLRVAAAAMIMGSFVFLIYNARHINRTLRDNAHLEVSAIPEKWIQVKNAANGNALFGYLVSEEWASNPKDPASTLGRLSAWLRDHLGEHRETGFYYVFGALLLTAPWWWRRRAARFSLAFIAVTWLAMAATKDAGGAAHHVILLWPFPILFAATALDALPWKKPAMLAGAVMIAMNLLVLNQYLAQFARNGAAGPFSDAIFALSRSFSQDPGKHIYVVDWGIFDSLTLLHQGSLDQRVLMDAPEHQVRAALQDPEAVMVGHVRQSEEIPNSGERLEKAAGAFGYQKRVLRTIPDSNGRPVFEIYHFSPL